MSDDDFDIAAYERSTRRGRRIRIGIIIAIAVTPFFYLLWTSYRDHAAAWAREAAYKKSQELTDSDRVEIRKLLATSQSTIAEARTAWSRATTHDAIAAVAVDDQQCGIRVDAPNISAGDSYQKYGSIDGNYFGNASYSFYEDGAAIGANPDLESAQRELAEIDERLKADTATKTDLDRARRVMSPEPYLFVIGKQQAPVALGNSYMPGKVTGMGYLYSYTGKRIACAGDVFAKNSPSIEINYMYDPQNVLDEQFKSHDAATATLSRDLQVQVQRELAANLRAVQ